MVAAQLSCIISWLVWASWEDYGHGCWWTDWNVILYLRSWLESRHVCRRRISPSSCQVIKTVLRPTQHLLFYACLIDKSEYFSVDCRGGTFKNQNVFFSSFFHPHTWICSGAIWRGCTRKQSDTANLPHAIMRTSESPASQTFSDYWYCINPTLCTYNQFKKKHICYKWQRSLQNTYSWI